MIFTQRHRILIIKIIAILFIVLFVYAATSKLLDFETFRVQIAQSPLLSDYAGIIAWFVPGLEILLAIFLMLPRYKEAALYACFTLMVMFTAYIVIILNYSDFIPCSCGGVLENLSWKQHLIFNCVFIALATMAIVNWQKDRFQFKVLMLGFLSVIGSGIVVLLFAMSEKEIKRNSAFIRRYPPNAAVEKKAIDLGVNSYYIIGIFDDKIYLGNYTAPLIVKVLSTSLENIGTYSIQLQDTDLPYRRIQIDLLPPYFYIADGTLAHIYRGSMKDWKTHNLVVDSIYFNSLVVMDSTRFGIRTESSVSGENLIASININSPTPLNLGKNLLEKQNAGIFENEGKLLWNKEMERLVYVYTYSNHFFSIKDSLKLDLDGRTIDTVKRPELKMLTIESKGQTKFGAPPLFINKSVATWGNYLFINSDRLGRYEAEDMLDEATIIDVYNLENGEYSYSFYIYFYKNSKLKSFKVENKKLFAIMDKHLVLYDLNR